MLFCLPVFKAGAQACDPSVDPFCNVDPDNPDVPLDDHIVYLMAAGLFVAAIYLRRQGSSKA